MEHILKVQKREVSTKQYTKNLRKQGEIPAIIYGNHKTALPISVNARTFKKQFDHISESTIITLDIDDQDKRNVLIKEYDYDIIKEQLRHIDFYEIEEGKKLKTNVNVSLIGNSEGIRLGGILEHFLHEVEIECLPKDLPEVITYDISALNIGDGIHISNLPKFEGVRYLAIDDLLVAQVIEPRAVVEEVSETDEEVLGEETESTETQEDSTSE